LGAANPILDRAPMFAVGGLTITRGWVSLAALVLRAALVVSAAICLTALTGFDAICSSLIHLGLPRVLAFQLRLMFRHLSTLSDEVGRASLAYRLRGGRRGIVPSAWGGLAGGLLVRSLDRAERIHRAMLCRGGEHPGPTRLSRFRSSDALYLGLWAAWFALCRLVDLSALVGALAKGIGRA
jgi:cobalt/nickel transport system permease protein